MVRIRHIILLGAIGAGIGFGCVIRHEDSGGGRDGTVAVDTNRASALVTGRFEGSIQGDVRVWVNDRERALVVAPDRTFVVREVPSGTVVFAIDVAGVRGAITIDDVQASEVIECSVRVDSGTVVITITRRARASEPAREVEETRGAPLVIDANNVCYFLRPGIYDRDIVIAGNHVSLLGAASCTEGERSVLNGTLVIRGNHALVHDVELRGSVQVTGNHARIQDTCSRCFADQCLGGGGSCGQRCTGGDDGSEGNGGNGSGTGNGGTTDAGGGSAADAGTTNDAGTTSDAGSPQDAGPAPDGGV